jgi:iron(II)-dependent oxidoreductase
MSEEQLIENFLVQVADSRIAGIPPAAADSAVGQLIGIIGTHSPLKPKAIQALTKCDWPLAVNFLSALTPPGMVFVPAGEFTMGSAEDDSEKPAHKVWLDSYYIDRAAVTNAQFGPFWEDVSYSETSEAWSGFEEAREAIYATGLRRAPYYWFDPDWNPPQRPLVGVNWYEAVVFARWSGKRLPTEAEWEKAARGTDGRRYPWGDSFDPARCNTNLAQNSANTTTPVGKFSPQGDSPYGAQDMAGNIWEWTSSAVRPYPYDPGDGREDLSRVERRVLRGGGYRSNFEDHYRSAHRYVLDANFIFITVGFRCATTVPPSARL